VFRTFSALFKIFLSYQGRRVPLRFTLAPGFYICAFGAQFRLLCKAHLHNPDDRMAQVYDLLCC
ncbi:MAG TPA: hypothetical protein VIW74_03560, partial [Pyrinomonadaceae bacterium]